MQRLLACFLGRELRPSPYLMRPREGQLVRFCHSTPGSLWYISVTSPSQRLSNVMDSMQSQRSPLRGFLIKGGQCGQLDWE